MTIKSFDTLIKAVSDLPPVNVSVAGGANAQVINSLTRGHELGFIGDCYLTGPETLLRQVISESGDDPGFYHIVPSETENEMNRDAVTAIRNNNAQILVKGSVKSRGYIKAILDSETGIKKSSVLSNLTLFEMPSLPRLIAVTDNAIIINPTLEEKAAIIRNSSPIWKALGIDPVRVAALSAVETVNLQIQSTVDAAALQTMSSSGQFPGFIVEGPLGYDAAISAESAKTKKLTASMVCGRVDMILAPNIETANILGKSYKFHGNARWGGLVFGATVPAVLNSRSDDGKNRLNSMAMARAIVYGRSLSGNSNIS